MSGTVVSRAIAYAEENHSDGYHVCVTLSNGSSYVGAVVFHAPATEVLILDVYTPATGKQRRVYIDSAHVIAIEVID